MPESMRFENRMSDADALMWTIEKDPLLRSTITAVAILDQAPDRVRLTDSVDRATLFVPRLRQRVVSSSMSIAPPRWEFDPHFDLGYHLRWTRAGGDGSLRDVLDMAQPIAMQGFDRARPLWEFTVVEGLGDGQKIHHSVTDGVGAVKIAMHLFDLERDVDLDRGEIPNEPDIHVMNQLERMRDALDHERRRQLGITRRAAATLTTAAASAIADAGGTMRRLRDTRRRGGTSTPIGRRCGGDGRCRSCSPTRPPLSPP